MGPWDFKTSCDMPRAQIILADDEIAGTVDLIYGAHVRDLKNTAKIESTYSLQLGGYAALYEHEHRHLPKSLGVIHVTQEKGKPVRIREVLFDVSVAVSEFRLLLEFYRLVQRKTLAK